MKWCQKGFWIFMSCYAFSLTGGGKGLGMGGMGMGPPGGMGMGPGMGMGGMGQELRLSRSNYVIFHKYFFVLNMFRRFLLL